MPGRSIRPRSGPTPTSSAAAAGPASAAARSPCESPSEHEGEAMGATTTNYTVISADCHGGASIDGYKPFLAARHHAACEAWAAEFENPYDDVEGDDADRNWDSDRRLQELEADGVVAEVIFP